MDVQHDSYILANSNNPDIIDQLPSIGWLPEDSGYPVIQERYNASHTKTRNCVERAFGVRKSRFR